MWCRIFAKVAFGSVTRPVEISLDNTVTARSATALVRIVIYSGKITLLELGSELHHGGLYRHLGVSLHEDIERRLALGDGRTGREVRALVGD